MTGFAAALAQAKEQRESSGQQTDIERILQIPEEDLQSQAEAFAEKWTRKLRKHPDAPALRPIQGLVLETAYRATQRGEQLGLLGNVAVGGGKTLIFLLLPRVMNCERAVYLFPPKLRSTVEAERWKWSQHYHIAEVEQVPYSTLSRPESTSLLRKLQPDLLMADECQALRNFSAARTKRFIRYLQGNPDTRFCGLTGTLTKGSVMDYAHLLELSLREDAPVPLEDSLLRVWASVIDHDGEPDDIAMSATAPLVEAYKDIIKLPDYTENRAREERRQAFYHRLRTTPGVILTTESSSDATIQLQGLSFKVSKQLKDALNTLTEEWVLPDGSEVIDALHMDRAKNELALGFYYIWDWPGEPDEEWAQARREWASSVRKFLQYRSREGLDSPFLVEAWVNSSPHAESIAPEVVRALRAWETQRQKPPPPTKPVWIDYTPLVKSYEWAIQQDGPVLLWFQTRAVAAALEELFGIPALFGEDPDPNVPIQALSTTVYHAGWNLQHWNNQLIIEPDSNPVVWEQLLGRTHRQGQKASVVRASCLQHVWPLRQRLERAVQRARTTQSTLHQQQKLLMAQRNNIGPVGL